VPDFEKLVAWQRAHQLALTGYGMSRSLPRIERYALADQMRRCAASIPVNVAEGHGRGSDREFAYFLRVALGSAFELQALALLARDLGYLQACDLNGFWPQAAETIRVIKALHRRIEQNIADQSK